MIEIVYRIDPDRPESDPRPATADDAQARLEAGNRAFAPLFDALTAPGELVRAVIPMSPAAIIPGDADDALTHQPFALVVGCADARAPIELIFGQGINDVFVLRVAGNVLGGEVIGSVDYALEYLPTLRLAVVLGHSQCGAIAAAVNAFLDPAAYLGLSAAHQLRAIVDHLFPAVRLGHASLLRRWGPDAPANPGLVPALIELSTAANAALMAASLRSELAERGITSARAVFGVYNLHTRRVGVPGLDGATETDHRLFAPPDQPDGFVALGRSIAEGSTIARLMSGYVPIPGRPVRPSR